MLFFHTVDYLKIVLLNKETTAQRINWSLKDFNFRVLVTNICHDLVIYAIYIITMIRAKSPGTLTEHFSCNSVRTLLTPSPQFSTFFFMFTFKLHVIVNHFNRYHNYGGRGGLLMSRVADNKTKKVILGVN